MYCRNCGQQLKDGSKFCNNCGAQQDVPKPEPQATDRIEAETEKKEPVFETIDWNVNDYPSANGSVAKTEDIDFDWGADPKEIRDRYTRGLSGAEQAEIKANVEQTDGLNIDDFIPSKPAQPVQEVQPQDLSAADKIDKFYTFSKKNEDFQKLLNKEYEKISGGNPLQQEQSIAEKTAEERFETRLEDPSMEAFLKREGIDKRYEPKAFDSEVLRKIEAQERAKEEARLEEEARQKAIEEARMKVEAEKQAAEEVRRRMEEEERKRVAEEARLRAIEEVRAKAAEEARIAEEEKIRAEKEARLMREREERIQAEAEARAKAEEEQARLRAESEIRAQQEAEKIRRQHEARQAATEEERYRAEVERRRQEEERLRDRINQTKVDLQKQANTVVANEAVKNALNQTARMKEEEAQKIRAAVAKLKGTPESEFAAPEPTYTQAASQVPIEDPILATAASQTSTYTPEEPLRREPVSEDARVMAHQATQNTLSQMARARQEFLENYEKEEAEKTALEPLDKSIEEQPVIGRNTMRTESTDMSETRTVDKNAVLAGLESTRRISKQELRAVEAIDAEKFETPSIKRAEDPIATVEDLLDQFMPEKEGTTDSSDLDDNKDTDILIDSTEATDIPEAPETDPLNEIDETAEGFAEKEEPTIAPADTAFDEDKPGLDNTMFVSSEKIEDNAGGSFDEYGEKEAEELKLRQGAEANNMEADKKEAKSGLLGKVTSRRAKPNKDDSKDKEDNGGAGRLVLKILLIVLIVIFAVELAGIGIKFIAPNSKAADVINNQLNKVIHLITGSDINYDIPGIEYKV